MSKTDAIREFKRLFLEKTGNPWEAWIQKTNFQKQPGRFYPLDIVCCWKKSLFTWFYFSFLWIRTDDVIYIIVGLRSKGSAKTERYEQNEKFTCTSGAGTHDDAFQC